MPELPAPSKLADVFTYHLCEVEGIEDFGEGDSKDTIFDINILPNRAHDLLSHQGIARELASLLNITFVSPEEKYKIPQTNPTNFKINIDTPNCRRYMGRIVRNIKIGPSPDWVKQHLESIGQRSINNIVDATNIVMYDCGQPAHAFDLKKVVGENIKVRQAKEKETMTTLDNKNVVFKESDMVIADDKNILAIAGVKGGKLAEVDNTTTDIILEIANFNPTSVRKTAQSLGIFTDSRKRFENDLPTELAPYAMRELSALIAEMCPEASFEEIVDVYLDKQNIKRVSFSVQNISRILGVEIQKEEVKNIFERYGFGLEEDSDKFVVQAPFWRLDLENESDIAEEVGRILGYDKVPPVISSLKLNPKKSDIYQKTSWAKNKLISDGYSEVMTYVFKSSGEVEVLESASDKKFLRTNLTDGLKESIKLNAVNAPFLELENVKVFEIGNIFLKDKEETRVVYGDKKNVIEVSLEQFCKEMQSDTNKNAPADVDADSLEKQSAGQDDLLVKKFKMWSVYPFVYRDVAVWIPDDQKADELYNILKENGGELLVKDPYMFDSFSKDGRTSYAYRLIFQSYEKTLTDEEVNSIMDKITIKIKGKNGWEVR